MVRVVLGGMLAGLCASVKTRARAVSRGCESLEAVGF